MEKLNGNRKLRASVFISGRGTNLNSIIKFSKKKKSLFEVILVISNNSKAKGLNIAKKNKIKYLIVNYKNKNSAENKVLKNLKKYRIDFVCLAGFMKILSKNFISNFKGKIINIHPSLLPKYKGLNTHERVIMNNEKFSGCTVHEVTSKLDSGKIIIQKKVKIKKMETPRSLAKKILKIEHEIYPLGIKKTFNF